MYTRRIISVVAALLIVACSGGGDPDQPYLQFLGGGFIFNYRLATADYGFVARVVRSLPEDAVVEARFEDPAGGAPIVIRQTASRSRREYSFRTPPLTGVRKDRDYMVELRVMDPGTERVLATYSRGFRSDVDQSILPAAPTVIGPGYQQPPPNPPGNPGTGHG